MVAGRFGGTGKHRRFAIRLGEKFSFTKGVYFFDRNERFSRSEGNGRAGGRRTGHVVCGAETERR